MRVLLAVVVWRSSPPIVGYTEAPDPVGMARVLDLGVLGSPGWMLAANVCLFLGLLAYVTGWFRTLGIVTAAFVYNAIYTLDNSQGSDHHHSQVVGLVLLVLALHHLWGAVRILFGRRDDPERREWFERKEFHFAQQTVIATYLVSAISKLIASGPGWIVDAQRFPLQIRKTERMQHFNVLDEVDAAGSSFVERIPEWVEQTLLASPVLAMVVIGSGLFLELGAVLALLGRLTNLIVGTLLVLFHLTVSKAMSLDFEHNVELLLILFVIPNFLLLLWKNIGVGPMVAGVFRGAGRVWSLFPLKPLFLVVAASFVVIGGPPFEFSKLRLVGQSGSVTDDLAAAEFYPLSPFPMYSRYSDRPIYVYLVDEKGEEFPLIPHSMQSSQIKKIYDLELRKVKKATGTPISKMSVEQKSIAGRETLRLIVEELAGEQVAASGFKTLRLREVVLTQGPEGIIRTETEVGAHDL